VRSINANLACSSNLIICSSNPQPNAVAYMNGVYEMTQAFVRFWSGDNLKHVKNAIDYYELELEWDYEVGATAV
jgi:hypothetical protein